VADDAKMHALIVIDIDHATAAEIQCVIRAVRESAVKSKCPGWPDQLAVLVNATADEVSQRVRDAVVQHRHPSFQLAPSEPEARQRAAGG
jgi:hypothetical protein